jgi:aspartate aminotransferase
VYLSKSGRCIYAIAKLPIDDADKFCQWLLESFSYKNQTVMLAPATGFMALRDWEKTK